MTVQAYYRHMRRLGAFRAVDALRIARQAAALDVPKAAPPALVSVETVEGQMPLRLSFNIKVY